MGGRKRIVSDWEILKIFIESSDPVMSAKEVSEKIAIGRQGTYQRLEELEDLNHVKSKKIGAGRAWWITEKGREYVQNENAPEA
jgi:CTP-dependent riboflavin kinase